MIDSFAQAAAFDVSRASLVCGIRKGFQGPDFVAQLDGKLVPLEEVIKRSHAAVPSMDIHLLQYAPVLCELSPAGELPLPGTAQGALFKVTVDVAVISTRIV
jgi:hypothetical protein